jgi:hypothetical protein
MPPSFPGSKTKTSLGYSQKWRRNFSLKHLLTFNEPHSVIRQKIELIKGRAVAQAVSRWFPTAAARVRVRAEHKGWTKRHWGRFRPSTPVSPANHDSTNFSIIIIVWGWHNRLISGRRTKCIQSHPTPRPKKKKWHL